MTRERQKETTHEDCSSSQWSGNEIHVAGKFMNKSEKKCRSLSGSEEESCPVCQETLGMQFMILPCGHMLCCRCKRMQFFYIILT